MSEQPFAGYLAAKEAEIRAGLVVQLRELAESTSRVNPSDIAGYLPGYLPGFLPGFLHGLRIAERIAAGHSIEQPSVGPGAPETPGLAPSANPPTKAPQINAQRFSRPTIGRPTSTPGGSPRDSAARWLKPCTSPTATRPTTRNQARSPTSSPQSCSSGNARPGSGPRWHQWGFGDCSSTLVAPTVKVMVLTEEVGEVARAVHDGQGLREELTQCAAVCIAWLESLPAE